MCQPELDQLQIFCSITITIAPEFFSITITFDLKYEIIITITFIYWRSQKF